jgi:competence protein ComEC
MKLPALWLAAAFAAGIVLSARLPAPASHAASLTAPLIAAVAPILAGLLIAAFARRPGHLLAAWICALLSWTALGALAATIERASVPANHVTQLIAAGRVDTSAALRWRGRLREDPLALPWGHRFELDLEQVEVAGEIIPVSGGLRANLYSEPRDASSTSGPWLAFRAGDRVEALLRARPPRNFKDPGAFDLQGYLANQKIDLLGTLRSGDLLQLVDRPRPTLRQRLARVRGSLLAQLDSLFADRPERAAVLRAMLLGDRSFVDSQVVLAFQKTAVYHVLVVAGLHVGALAAFLFWLCRRLRLSIATTSFITLIALAAYVGVVQDRPPIFRAALIAAFYLCARPLFRRIELLQVISLAALVILFWKPSSLADPSFQLSFLAAGVIAALALPWIDRSSAPYRSALAHIGDVTRDSVHAPKLAQFRLELRDAAHRFAAHLPARLASRANAFLSAPVRLGLRLWEIVLLSTVIQWGMVPMLARDFHRVSLAGPLSNIPSVLLTGIIVPLGFLTLAATFVWSRLAALLARPLGVATAWLLAVVDLFSR